MIKVLSLCDGIASGLEAFKRLGVPVEYHAIELEQWKRDIADANHSGIVRPEHDLIEYAKRSSFEHFDYILCGFTCTSLTSQGNREEWDGDSKIFFDCLTILKGLKAVNPNLKFFFENVHSMRNVCRDFISAELGAPAFLGESKLVAAQDRKRYYWFNWNAPVIEDRNVLANDLLDEDGLHLFSFSKSNRNKKGEAAIVEGRMKAAPKSGTLLPGPGCNGQSTMNKVITKKMTVRNMTVSECSRFQGVGHYNWNGSTDAQIFRAIGEGWSVEMVVELLRGSL